MPFTHLPISNIRAALTLTIYKSSQHQLKVQIEHKNRFLFTIIFDKKNRYIAWTGNTQDRSVLKNLDGMSRKYPTWIKQQVQKIATHLITKSNVDILPIVKTSI